MSADYIQANTDGRLHDAREPSIAPLNRGFLYGDAIYEVWRTYEGIIFAWDEHWRRLENSARSLFMALPFTQAQCLEQIRRTAQAFGIATKSQPELYIRLQISRGAGAIGLNPALADHSSYVILVQSLKLPTAEQSTRGIRLGLAVDLHRNPIEALNPAWKTGNYLNNILCLREALARGTDEVVMTNLAGEITESAVSNIFFVRDGILCTPPLSAGILEGITRATIVQQIAPLVGCQISEAPIRAHELDSFQECFISSTTREITPVRAIEDIHYSTGSGTLTVRLQNALAAHTLAVARKRPELRVW